MNDSSVASLIYVCRVSGARLRDLGRQLEVAEPRRVEPILRAIQAEGDGLSAALTRLSHFADALPDDPTEGRENAEPEADLRLLEIVRRLRIGAKFGLCACGGIRSHGGGHGHIESDAAPAAIARARRAEGDHHA